MASFLVYIYHMGYFSGYRFDFIGNYGSEAVILFFVLSGLVVTYSAELKHKDIADFAVSRLARLWSIVLPALLLTFVSDTIGRSLMQDAYFPLQAYSAFKWIASILINAFFINQVWGFSIYPGSNGPFWSLSYEFWYYCLFGLFFYLKGYQRVLFFILACIIVGPKILIAFPIWLIGTGLYYTIKRNIFMPAWLGFCIWVLSILLLFLYGVFEVTTFLETTFPAILALSKAQWAVNFLPKSIIIGLIFACNIYGFNAFGMHVIRRLNVFTQIVRLLAATSFGLYLFHYPLGYLFKAITMYYHLTGSLKVFIIYSCTLVVSSLLALYFESTKSLFYTSLNGFVSFARRMVSGSQKVDM